MSSIWHELDRTPVPAEEAAREWALRGHDILTEIAPRFGRTISSDDLAHEVQRRSQIVTQLPSETWLHRVLGAISDRCRESGEPDLTCLVVDQPAEVDAARLRCHQAFGAKIPDPDAPRRTRARSTSTASRSGPRRGAAGPAQKVTTARSSTEPRRRPVCPSCFMELPATGICDDCS